MKIEKYRDEKEEGNMEKTLAIIIAITVPIALIVLVAIVVCLIRRFMDKSRMGSVVYDRISHELDDEEVSVELFFSGSDFYYFQLNYFCLFSFMNIPL